MTSEYHTILVPKENASDDLYTVTEISLADGTEVQSDSVVLVLETSKADVELEAGFEGFIFYLVSEGEELPVGAKLAVVSSTAKKPDLSKISTPAKVPGSAATGIRVSATAQALMDENGLSTSNFPGQKLIRDRDVKALLSRVQRASDWKTRLAGVTPNHVIVWGASGHAGACIDIALQNGLPLAGIVASPVPDSDSYMGVPVIGEDDLLGDIRELGIDLLLLGIGSVQSLTARQQLLKRAVGYGFVLPNLIHPTAAIEPSVLMGTGNQVFAGAVVGSNVVIGDNCMINSGAIVSHNCKIGNNVHIAPGAILAGGVTVEDNVLVGMGSTLFMNVSVGRGAIINNGISIFKDIAPGRVVKE